jgi:membrane associated rhomboid family serine protease
MNSAWEEPETSRAPHGLPGLTPGVKGLLIANVALFVLQWVLLDHWFPRAFEFVGDAFALNPAQWLVGFPLVPPWQLVTYGFLHGGPEHLLFNLLFLYMFGTLLEGELGARRFLVFYFATLVVAGACQLALGLALGQTTPIVGASGGVLAIVCAMATLRPGLRMIFIVVPMTLRTMALIFIALDTFRAISQLKGEVSHVASFAHLSGALFGYLAVRQRWIFGDPLARLDEWRARRDVQRQEGDERRLDELLVKIEKEGIHSLSSGEKAFLKRVSQRR